MSVREPGIGQTGTLPANVPELRSGWPCQWITWGRGGTLAGITLWEERPKCSDVTVEPGRRPWVRRWFLSLPLGDTENQAFRGDSSYPMITGERVVCQDGYATGGGLMCLTGASPVPSNSQCTWGRERSSMD